jgi:predicted small lipoprotein YifL
MTGAQVRRLLFVAAAAMLATLAGCGGGGGSSAPPTPPVAPQNIQPIVVDMGTGGFPNLLFTSVTICAPGGSTNCQTIDHVQIDTGSTGLRIISSVLSPALALRQQVDGNGNPIAECAQFVDGFSWGPVKVADIHLAGEVASSVPVQVIGDPAFPNIPASCSNVGPPENTVDAFGANGVLGVGLFLQDCGAACAQLTIPGAYYICPATGCQVTRLAVALQVQHPVALFATDNNGVVIQLPSIPQTGAATASGSMIFGIGTQTNNGTSGLAILTADPSTGNITTVYNNQTYVNSYIDSGSNGLFFGTNAFTSCGPSAPDFYCPATTQTLSASIRGTNNVASTVTFFVGNVLQLLDANPNFFAFNDLAGTNSDPASFAWGLPFFYGRSVYTAIETRTTPAGTGPYYAF